MKILGRLRVSGGLLILALALRADGKVDMHCRHNTGRLVVCWATGVDDRQIVPHWRLDTKPGFTAYVAPPNEFRFLAPKRWTRIILTAFGDEEHDTVQACAEVRYVRNRKVEMREPCAKVGQ